jgi:hypothetical protein
LSQHQLQTPSLDATEAVGAAGSTRQRVTLESMKARVVEEHFFTAGEALDGILTDNATISPQLDVLTLCVLVLDNGWVLTGQSAPADPTNFDKEKGKTFAYEDALRKLWPLEGYLLRERLWSDLDPEENDDG